MKKLVLVAGLLGLPMMSVANTYTIDSAHTYPNFVINHLGFSDVYGRFNSTKGTLSMDKAKGTGAVEVVIDAASIDTGFDKRDDHLRSPDFFNVNEFPQITFKSSKVTYKDAGAEIAGNLTIKGVTKPVTLNVDKINCGVNPMNKKEVCGFGATTRFKRSEFGVSYGLPGVGDDITLILTVEAVKN